VAHGGGRKAGGRSRTPSKPTTVAQMVKTIQAGHWPDEPYGDRTGEKTVLSVIKQQDAACLASPRLPLPRRPSAASALDKETLSFWFSDRSSPFSLAKRSWSLTRAAFSAASSFRSCSTCALNRSSVGPAAPFLSSSICFLREAISESCRATVTSEFSRAVWMLPMSPIWRLGIS